MFPYIDLLGQRIYSYPLLMGMAWGAAINLVLHYSVTMPAIRNLRGLIVFQFLGAWVGAKLLFIVTAPEELQVADQVNFWLGGGFVFYGGLILTVLLSLVWVGKGWMSWKQGQIFIPALALGHAIGRIGCFLAGCCFGVESHLPWAIHLHGADRHPVQLYESIFLLILAGIFHRAVMKERSYLWQLYFIIYGGFRIGIEFLRGDQVRGVTASGVSTSQAVSLVLMLVCIVAVFVQRHQKAKLLRS